MRRSSVSERKNAVVVFEEFGSLFEAIKNGRIVTSIGEANHVRATLKASSKGAITT